MGCRERRRSGHFTCTFACLMFSFGVGDLWGEEGVSSSLEPPAERRAVRRVTLQLTGVLTFLLAAPPPAPGTARAVVCCR